MQVAEDTEGTQGGGATVSAGPAGAPARLLCPETNSQPGSGRVFRLFGF